MKKASSPQRTPNLAKLRDSSKLTYHGISLLHQSHIRSHTHLSLREEEIQ